MTPYLTYTSAPGTPGYSPYMSAYAAKREQRVEGARGAALGEVPSQPPVLSGAQITAVEELLRPGPVPEPPAELVNRLGARR